MTVLLKNHRSWLRGLRVGLVSHPAAIDATGAPEFILAASQLGPQLKALFGPEHGFHGTAGAGTSVQNLKHPFLRCPVYSLYGDHRRLTADMLKNIDVIIFDLQDIAARCYTYVSTLLNILEDAALHRKTIIIADRPVPAPDTIDGPMLDAAFSSFVGCIPAPLSYGMTPGETALWLKTKLSLTVNLRIAKMAGYHRETIRQPDWPQWIPPSPAMLSWESAWCYTATVLTEALPALDCGRSSGLPFQVFGAPWMQSKPVCNHLEKRRLPGVSFHPHSFRLHKSEPAQILDGIRINVTNPDQFLPVTTGIEIISCIQNLYGQKRLWSPTGTRPEFFDKLCGTDSVRKALFSNADPRNIVRQWQQARKQFITERNKHLLYKTLPTKQGT